ncbi:MAG TPA: glycosyl hydrolase family 18 protein [Thermoanaerobaculia bacterium]|nr:glycosyl hydrolase family 18 protein [Thermoanaerobaculia bacterium]
MKRLIFAFALTIAASSAYANNYRISVWMRIYWDNPNSVANFNTENAGQFVHEVNPFWYYFTTVNGPNGPVVVLKDKHEEPRDRPTLGNAALVPIVRNHDTVNPDPYTPQQYMSFIFRSEADMNDHADKIAAMVNNNGYAGVDIDYEEMLRGGLESDVPKYRDNFTSLIRRIKKRLPNKIVSVCVYRKRSVTGEWDSSQSRIYDYRGLTENGAADYLKIMMYNDIGSKQSLVHNQYMDEALTFARDQVSDHKKIIVGLPWYAHNFDTGKSANSVATPGGTVGRNINDELTFTSPFNGVQIDAYALQQKILKVIRKHDVGGFAFYMSGQEMGPAIWDVVRGRIGPEGSTAVASAPVDGTGCNGNGIISSVSTPAGATNLQYNWFQSQAKCCTAVWGMPLWVANSATSTSPASPALPAAFHSLRVSGVTGNRVFEVEADPIRSGCP